LHEGDLFLYERASEQGAMFGVTVRQPPPVDAYYDGSPIAFGGFEVHVHHTPGHCSGGVCLQVGPKGEAARHLFVGDTLFDGSIGRTDLPGGDYQVLMRSITEVLFPLGDEAIVHPGHGPDTTIGRERATNPFVLEYLAGRKRVRLTGQ
jgi:glyoxylase-like metal-dependent hydrolase (beta-lactamase superfamily II)